MRGKTAGLSAFATPVGQRHLGLVPLIALAPGQTLLVIEALHIREPAILVALKNDAAAATPNSLGERSRARIMAVGTDIISVVVFDRMFQAKPTFATRP